MWINTFKLSETLCYQGMGIGVWGVIKPARIIYA